MYRFFILSLLMFSGGLQLDAQCYPDRHNTTWYDSWISCEAAENPNPVRGKSHWILYNLGYTYHLGQMHVWNSNAPDFLNDGIQTALIDVSVDGINWTEVGEFEFEQAPGRSTYEGFIGPDLTGYEAKYLLITAQSNWGGTCYGLSEIRVDVSGVTNVPKLAASNDCLDVKAFPNPASERSAISVIAGCSEEDIRFVLLDITGRAVADGWVEGSHGLFQFDLQLDQFQPGTYLLTVEQEGIQHREKMVKIR